MNILVKVSIVYLIWNGICFIMMGADKMKAKTNSYRISEVMLLVSAFLFGALGICLGMVAFHHKVSKMKFRILVPLFVVLNMFLLHYIIKLF